jgi:hypothetical protein
MTKVRCPTALNRDGQRATTPLSPPATMNSLPAAAASFSDRATVMKLAVVE